jgi:glycosyltransferase involved in cell wall biosynthesis
MNDSNPLVSIVIACWNSAEYIAAALDSVLHQDYRPLEVVVVDDGSTDNTLELVRARDPELVRVISQENSGRPSIPRNAGIRNSSGELVFIFDSDDVMKPGKIRKTVELWQIAPGAGLVFTNFETMDPAGAVLKKSFLDDYSVFRATARKSLGNGRYLIAAADAYAALLHGNFIGTSSTAIPRSVLGQVGLFDESLRVSEDKDLWFRILRNHDLAFLDEVCHRYRVHGQGLMSSGNIANGPDLMEVMKRQLATNLPGSLRKVVLCNIAETCRCMGYEFQHAGDPARARENYLAGMRTCFGWGLLRGWLGTFMISRHLRGIARRLSRGG